MSLLRECIDALNGEANVIVKEAIQVKKELKSKFPFNDWGRINWDKVKHQKNINTINEIRIYLNKVLGNYTNDVYILWDEGSLPVIESNLEKVFEVIDDVTAVSFDTWIISSTSSFVIEIFHDGEVIIGVNP